MKILFDWDNTVVNFMELFIAKFAELFPNKPVPRWTQLTDYDLSKTFDIPWDHIEIIFNQLRVKNFYKAAAPVDATFFIWWKKLLAEGHEIAVCTKNDPSLEPLFQYWLSEYGIYDTEFIFVETMKEKLGQEFDVLVDDYPGLISENYWKNNPKKHLLVYDAPWNYRILTMGHNVARVYNWEKIHSNIQFIEEKNGT